MLPSIFGENLFDDFFDDFDDFDRRVDRYLNGRHGCLLYTSDAADE